MEEEQNAAYALTWMDHDGSELVNSWETATKDTAKESLKNTCDGVALIFKPESSTLLSR